MGRFVERREQDVPTLAVAPCSAGERHRKNEMKGRDLPLVLRQIAFPAQTERLKQIGLGVVLAVLLLNARENRELALRAHMDLEPGYSVDDVLVDALAIPAVRFAAGLPVPLENVSGIPRIRRELRWGANGDGRG